MKILFKKSGRSIHSSFSFLEKEKHSGTAFDTFRPSARSSPRCETLRACPPLEETGRSEKKNCIEGRSPSDPPGRIVSRGGPRVIFRNVVEENCIEGRSPSDFSQCNGEKLYRGVGGDETAALQMLRSGAGGGAQLTVN